MMALLTQWRRRDAKWMMLAWLFTSSNSTRDPSCLFKPLSFPNKASVRSTILIKCMSSFSNVNPVFEVCLNAPIVFVSILKSSAVVVSAPGSINWVPAQAFCGRHVRPCHYANVLNFCSCAFKFFLS